MSIMHATAYFDLVCMSDLYCDKIDATGSTKSLFTSVYLLMIIGIYAVNEFFQRAFIMVVPHFF